MKVCCRLLVPVLASACAVVPIVAQTPPAPRIGNATIQAHVGPLTAPALPGLAASANPVWIGWRVPLVAGEGGLCSIWSTDDVRIRGGWLEDGPRAGSPSAPSAENPVRLESLAELVILTRWRDGQPEQLRVFSGDCSLDAGGRTVHWFVAATPSDSLAVLDGLTRPVALEGTARAVAEAAVTAIGLHADAAADRLLERLSGPESDERLRQRAFSALSTSRGVLGFSRLSRLLEAAAEPGLRRTLVAAIGASDVPEATERLLGLARTEARADVRGEAAYHYARRAGPAGLVNTRSLIDGDASEIVRRRAVAGLARLADRVRVPVLVELAETSRHPDVRREAVRALGQSDDARAAALLQQIVAR